MLAAFDDAYEQPLPIATAVFAEGAATFAWANAAPESRFEFGSIGKTMTAQVLAALVVDGIVALDDPIGKWLDGGDNGSITLEQLATHTSGLPRLAANGDDGVDFDERDPYATYNDDLAEAALREVTRNLDATSEYSNFGYQLLGVALGRAAGTSFDELLHSHVFEPFGLATASVGPGADQVQGYMDGKTTPAWRVLLAGPGGVSGTIGDVLAWGRAVLNPPAGLAGEALALALQPRFADLSGEVGLAWHFLEDGTIWHNGGTYGSRSCLAVSPNAQRVAACLVATFDLDFVDRATFLACAGGDPTEVRPQPAGDERNLDALAFVTTLIEQRWTDAQDAMSDTCRAALTVERLSEAWVQVMVPRGTHQTSTVNSAARHGRNTEVTVDLTFANGTGVAKVTFDADAKVVGLWID